MSRSERIAEKRKFKAENLRLGEETRRERERYYCDVLDRFRAINNSSVFIETGTFKGDTTALAAERFEQVYTIELSDELFRSSKAKLSSLSNVVCLHGDSKTLLGPLVQTINADVSILFYLDAHYFQRGLTRSEKGRMLVPKTSPFPLVEELEVIANRRTSAMDVVVVDDVHRWGRKHPVPEWYTVSADMVTKHLSPRTIVTEEFDGDRFVCTVGPSDVGLHW